MIDRRLDASVLFNKERNAYFGDLHVHTTYSFDAYAFGTLATPSDAYHPQRVYEYTTGSAGRGNLHRNVVFESSDAVPEIPFSRVHSNNPEDLWTWMDTLHDAGVESTQRNVCDLWSTHATAIFCGLWFAC